jgi:DNA-binding NtrC family response regulator
MEDEAGGAKLNVLIVDDNPDDRRLVMRELQREFDAVSVHEVVDRTSLYDTLSRGGFHLVVTDYQLKWSDGLAVGRAIKARYPDCPMIMFTNSGDEEVAVQALKQGVDDYVLKRKGYHSLARAAKNVLSLSETKLGRTPRCLIVAESAEDHGSLGALVRRFHTGAYVDSHERLESGVESLLRGGDVAYDAFIWFVRTSQSNGIGGLREALKRYPLLPVLVINDGRPSYFQMGAWAVMSKPVDDAIFLAWLARAFSVSSLARTVRRQNEALERYARALEEQKN